MRAIKFFLAILFAACAMVALPTIAFAEESGQPGSSSLLSNELNLNESAGRLAASSNGTDGSTASNGEGLSEGTRSDGEDTLRGEADGTKGDQGENMPAEQSDQNGFGTAQDDEDLVSPGKTDQPAQGANAPLAALESSANASNASESSEDDSDAQQDGNGSGPSVLYRTHVQNVGTQEWQQDGSTAGTEGFGLRLESIEVELESDLEGILWGQAHVENIGWQRLQGASSDGATIKLGTEGQALRMEAVRFSLSGDLSRYYDITYRVHVENLGWQSWVLGGDIAGTLRQALRLEAIEMKLVEKDPSAGDSASDGAPALVYAAHVENLGWQPQQLSGETAGTTGQSLRVEALRVWLDDASYTGDVEYELHVENVGWQGSVKNGAVAGTTGEGLRAEALRILLSGDIAAVYDIAYRAHVQDIGWQPWAVNGGIAGTTGRALRVEAIQIKLVRKGNYAIAEGTYEITPSQDAAFAVDDPNFATALETQMQIATRNLGQAQKFYIRQESQDTYSIQVVASGLFLADKAGKVAQVADSSSDDSQRWTMLWDGGVVLVNLASGNVIALGDAGLYAGAKLLVSPEASSNNQRWVLSQTQLITNGYYEIQSRNGTYVDVSWASYAKGANVQAYSHNGSAAQNFHIYLHDGAYVIENNRSFMVLDVDGASTSNGANVMQHPWNGGGNQRWIASIDREGYLSFESVNSGKVLAISGNSSEAGANVCQYESTGEHGQQWKVVPVSRYTLSGDEQLDRYVASVLSTHDTLWSAFNWVVNHSYRDGERYWSGPRVLSDSHTAWLAKDFFAWGSGNCYQFAAAFNWLARGLGYSCNVISGWVVGYATPQAPHGWVEVYDNGGVYVCDPELQYQTPSRNWFWQTYDSAPTAYYNW